MWGRGCIVLVSAVALAVSASVAPAPASSPATDRGTAQRVAPTYLRDPGPSGWWRPGQPSPAAAPASVEALASQPRIPLGSAGSIRRGCAAPCPSRWTVPIPGATRCGSD